MRGRTPFPARSHARIGRAFDPSSDLLRRPPSPARGEGRPWKILRGELKRLILVGEDTMRKIVGLAAVLALAAGASHAQVALDQSKPQAIASILTWSPKQQAVDSRTIEKIFKTHTIRRGTKVHPLPKAAKQIDPTFTYQGRTWTTDQYMKAYRVSGLLVLKDGKIVMEKYGLGRKPTD